MFKIQNIDKLNQLIKDQCKIEEVVQNMYGIELFPVGNGDYKALCPFHDEKTPSFGIRGPKQVYHCFGCKEGGDVISLVQKIDKATYADALLSLAQHAKIDITPFKAELTKAEKQELFLCGENARIADLTHKNLVESETAQEWMKRRRLNAEVLELYRVGFSTQIPDSNDEYGLEFNWPGKWENVITVPLMNEYGSITGFRNRMLDAKATVKVLGPKKNSHPLKQPQLYGLSQARKYIRSAGALILVEGEIDVWQMVAHGYRNTASTLGTKLNADIVSALENLSINQVILMADNDEAGRKFSASVAEEFTGSKLIVKIARLVGEGKDPDEILLAQGTDPIDRAIANAKYAFEYFIEQKAEDFNLSTTTGRIEFLNEVKDKIKDSPQLIKHMAIKLMATMTDTSYDVISDFIIESNDKQVELHNTLAERIVLKKMLTDEMFIGEALMQISMADFFLKKHRTVFDSISRQYRAQQDVNADTVLTNLENLKIEGAQATIKSVMSRDVDESSAHFMIKDLRDKSIRRSVQEKARDAANRLGNTDIDATDIIRELSTSISKSIVSAGSKLVSVADSALDRMNLIMDRVRNKNPIIGFNLGPDMHTLNMTLHGLQTKRYVVVAAPSGAGKTAFACILAKRLAVDLKVPTTFFTFETGIETITDRIISHISAIPSDQFLTGYINAADIERVQDAASILASSPLVITERGMTYEDFEAIVRHDVISRGTKVVIVDYVQLMELSNARGISRHLEVGKISRGLLELSKELDVAMVAIAQQNRESVKGNNASKEGVGDSYKIAQDADAYIVFREKTKEELQADGPEKGNRLLILDKNRHGKGGIIMPFEFDKDRMQFFEVKTSKVTQQS